MNENTKKHLLKIDAGNTIRKSSGFMEFEVVDPALQTKTIIRGGEVDGKILFRAKAEKDLYELKGQRFYRTDDKALGLAFSKGYAEVPEVKKVIKDVPSELVEQLAYDGTKEYVHAGLYCNKVVCKCGNVRWVKNSDLFQVKFCKPCTIIERRQKNKERRATK
jgi:hypothetical protein